MGSEVNGQIHINKNIDFTIVRQLQFVYGIDNCTSRVMTNIPDCYKFRILHGQDRK